MDNPITDPLAETVEPGQESIPEPDNQPAEPESQPEVKAEEGAEPTPVEGDSAKPEQPEQPEPPTVEARIAAVEAENKSLRERLEKPSEPDKPAEPVKSQAEIEKERVQVETQRQEDTVLSEAHKLDSNPNYRDEMIAEHGEAAVRRVERQADRILNRREMRVEFHQFTAGQQRAEQEKANKEAWSAADRQMGSTAKSYGLPDDVFTKDDKLKALRGLEYPDAMVKQAMEDRLFRLRSERGLPPKSRDIVTAEEHANRQAVYQRSSGASSNPSKKSIGDRLYEQAQADASAVDPLSDSRPA